MSLEHIVAQSQTTLRLDFSEVLPGVDSERDGCIERLCERLRAQNGIAQVHVDSESGKPQLCLHYSPNLVTLEKLRRLAYDEGTAITQRFKHETLPIAGMDCGSCAASVEHVVKKVPGILNVNVNYPTGKMKVEYDSTLTNREAIIKAVGKLGYRVPIGQTIALPLAGSTPAVDSHAGHDHNELEAEKKIYEAQAAEEGKPEAIQAKIAEGRLNREFFQAACLMDQPFVKEQKQTIEQLVKEAMAKLGENIQVKRFTRFKVGEN